MRSMLDHPPDGLRLERVRGIEPPSLAWEALDFAEFLRVLEQNSTYSTRFASMG